LLLLLFVCLLIVYSVLVAATPATRLVKARGVLTQLLFDDPAVGKDWRNAQF
jgi:hypothetical protein